MSTKKSSGTGIASGKNQPQQLPRKETRPMKGGDNVPPAFMDKAGIKVMDRFDEKFRLAGNNVNPDNFQEITILEQFLGSHVQANRICDVQCMLLWSEWVRNFRRQTQGYPNQILEKEFRKVITDNYGIKIANYSARGSVYSGLRFIP